MSYKRGKVWPLLILLKRVLWHVAQTYPQGKDTHSLSCVSVATDSSQLSPSPGLVLSQRKLLHLRLSMLPSQEQPSPLTAQCGLRSHWPLASLQDTSEGPV